MANNIALGLVIGGAVSSTVGAAFKDVEGRIKHLEAQGTKARVLQRTIGDTIRLRDEWKKANDSGAAGAGTLLRKLESNLSSLKKQGVEVRNLAKAYQTMGQVARKSELKAVGHSQINEGKEGLSGTIGRAAAATAVAKRSASWLLRVGAVTGWWIWCSMPAAAAHAATVAQSGCCGSSPSGRLPIRVLMPSAAASARSAGLTWALT